MERRLRPIIVAYVRARRRLQPIREPQFKLRFEALEPHLGTNFKRAAWAFSAH